VCLKLEAAVSALLGSHHSYQQRHRAGFREQVNNAAAQSGLVV
jgi:hypothetical protein